MPSSNTPSTLLRPEIKRVVDVVVKCLPEMVEHAASKPGEEVVGAIMADGFTVRLTNEAEDRSAAFVISPRQLKHLDSLVAVYHSHPDGSELISVTDEKGLEPIHAVIVTSEAIVLWWHSDSHGYYRAWDLYYGIE